MSAADRRRREHARDETIRTQRAARKQAYDSAVAAMASLKAQLEAFGVRHRDELQRSGRDPWQSAEFRGQFLGLFRKIGVDPLSSSKNMWSQALGTGLVKFYADLAVAAAGVCIATRPLNGGLLSLSELTERLNRQKRGGGAGGGGSGGSGSAQPAAFTADDVAAALGRLAVLSGGFDIVELAGEQYVRSVSEALETDGTALLSAAAQARQSSTTAAQAAAALGWRPARAQSALDALTRESMAWLDVHGGVTTYYFPSFYNFA